MWNRKSDKYAIGSTGCRCTICKRAARKKRAHCEPLVRRRRCGSIPQRGRGPAPCQPCASSSPHPFVEGRVAVENNGRGRSLSSEAALPYLGSNTAQPVRILPSDARITVKQYPTVGTISCFRVRHTVAPTCHAARSTLRRRKLCAGLPFCPRPRSFAVLIRVVGQFYGFDEARKYSSKCAQCRFCLNQAVKAHRDPACSAARTLCKSRAS